MVSFAGVLDEPDTLHKYLYVGADPVNLTDPSGEAELAEFAQRVKERVEKIVVYMRKHGRDILCRTLRTSSLIVSILGGPDGVLTVQQVADRLLLPLCPCKPTPGFTRVFRVEGIPNRRLVIGSDGSVNVLGSNVLWLNFGQRGRALSYLRKKINQNLPGAELKSFLVPNSFLDRLRRTAVTEPLRKRFPNNPIRSADPFPDQYGLPGAIINELINVIVPGSGGTGSDC